MFGAGEPEEHDKRWRVDVDVDEPVCKVEAAEMEDLVGCKLMNHPNVM